MRTRTKVIIGILILIIAAIAFGLLFYKKTSKNETDNGAVLCATDVRECTDGSYVSRVPPGCDFSACPSGTRVIDPKSNENVSCPVGECSFDIYAADSGKTFNYTTSSRFTIFLSEIEYPKEELKIDCSPKDSIGSISNVPAVTPPLYAIRYEGVKLGTCTVSARDFSVKVNITD